MDVDRVVRLVVHEQVAVYERLTVMNMGSLLASGLPQEVTTNKEVISAYLGQGDNI